MINLINLIHVSFVEKVNNVFKIKLIIMPTILPIALEVYTPNRKYINRKMSRAVITVLIIPTRMYLENIIIFRT